jgi:hypothetical protein
MPCAATPSGYLVDDKARAAIVLWASGQFDTLAIAEVLDVREDAVCRTLRMARDAVVQDASTSLRGR